MSADVWTGQYSVPSHILMQELPEQGLIFLDLRSEEYFGLDAVGTRMYRAVTSAGRAEKALDVLEDEFAVDAPTLRADLAAFLAQLVERGLIAHDPD